jgi:site-specific DNA-methyltransferase (adenine-specific)
VMKYGKMNWLRLWLLNMSPPIVDRRLFSSSSLPKYVDFMSKVVVQLERVLADNGHICLVVGDVARKNNSLNLAEEIAAHCVTAAGLRIDAVINDEIPVRHKVSRIWRERRGYATKTDRILILSRPGTSRLPRVPTTRWH